MARTRELKVKITGDERDLARAFGKSDSSASKWGRRLSTFGKVAALGLAGAGLAAVKFGIDFVEAAEESVKIGKQTEAVIKSTGGAAKVTAGHVADLAEKLSLKAGIDDELIQSGANVLLTFTQIRNEVGKGNDIFDQATTLALDMSVALGQDLQSSVIQIGKALNDPIRGVTALRRVGVQLTEQQEESIKTFIEQGDVLSAQKVILGELATEFGGSAEAQATATDKLKVAFDNIAEQIGGVLLPYVNQFSDWLVQKGIPLIRDQLVPWIQNELVPALEDFAHWIRDEVVPNLQKVGPVIRDDIMPALQQLTEAIMALPGAVQIALASLGLLARWGGFGILAGAATIMGKVIATVFGFIGFAATMAFSLILRILPFAHIATLAFIFRDKLAGVFRFIGEQGQRLFNNLQNWGATAVRAIGGFFLRLGGTIANAFRAAWGTVSAGASAAVGAIVRFFSSLPGRLAGIGRRAAEAILAPFKSLPGKIGDILSNLPGAGIVKRGLGILNPFGAVGGIVTPMGIQHLAFGGLARGTDTVPAMLTPGEMVLTHADQVALLSMIRGGGGGDVYNISFAGAIISSERDAQRWVVDALSRAGGKGRQITIRGRPL